MNSLEAWVLRFVQNEGLQIPEEKIRSVLQFVKFGIVGFSNTVIAYLINVAVLWLLRNQNVSWDYVAGNVVAFVLSVLWSFYWNNKYVFQSDPSVSPLRKLMKTYLAYGFTGIILNNALSYVWINILHISKYIAPLINLIISVPLNFILHRLWVYR